MAGLLNKILRLFYTEEPLDFHLDCHVPSKGGCVTGTYVIHGAIGVTLIGTPVGQMGFEERRIIPQEWALNPDQWMRLWKHFGGGQGWTWEGGEPFGGTG